jgi:hypothetical protein
VRDWDIQLVCFFDCFAKEIFYLHRFPVCKVKHRGCFVGSHIIAQVHHLFFLRTFTLDKLYKNSGDGNDTEYNNTHKYSRRHHLSNRKDQ